MRTIKIFRLLLFPLKSSHPPKNTCQILLPPPKNLESKIFWEGRFGLKTGTDFAYRVYMVCEGTTGVCDVFIISVSNSDRPQRRRPRRNGCFRRLSFKWLRNKEKYANSKWILTNLFCFCSNLSTVLVRLSARGAYLLLVPQSWRALVRERALFSLLRNNRMLKTKLSYFLKQNNNRSFSSKKDPVNVQLTWGNFDRFLSRHLW